MAYTKTQKVVLQDGCGYYEIDDKPVIPGKFDETKATATFYINKMPATVAFDVAMYFLSPDIEHKKIVRKEMFKYIEIELGPDKRVPLENDTIINQHLSFEMVSKLTKISGEFQFGATKNESPSA